MQVEGCTHDDDKDDKDDDGKQKEDEKREKNDVLLSSDDTDDENDKDESSRLDEEREEKHQKWEIIAKFPPRVVRETTKGGANASSLLEAWIKAVPRKGKRTLKAVGFGAIRATVSSKISPNAIFAWKSFGALKRDARVT